MCVYVCMCVYTVNVHMKILSVFTGYYKLAHTANSKTSNSNSHSHRSDESQCRAN